MFKGRSFILAAMLGAAAALTIAVPRPAFAGTKWGPASAAGLVQYNSGANVVRGERNNATHEYGWQVSGPFSASVTSITATVIVPKTKATNLVDGTSYQGPFRVLFACTQQIQYQATSLTYGPGVTWTAGTLGVIVAANVLGDTNNFGTLWPGGGVALQLSPTVSGAASNLTYWVEDQDW